MSTLQTNYASFSIEELERALADVNGRRDDLSAQAKAITAVLDVKRAEAAAAARLAAMGPAEREALKAALLAE